MPQHNTPKRFYKPVCYIDKPRKPIKCLSEIFMLFELPDIREEISLWQQLAVCTEGHVYDQGAAREDLIEYTGFLLRLCEALYVIYAASSKAKKEERKLTVSKKIRKKIKMRRRPVLLTEQQIKDPYIVIDHFCTQFSKRYAHTELSDMVDAVISYKGARKCYRGNIMLLYRCLRSLLKLSRILNKTKKK